MIFCLKPKTVLPKRIVSVVYGFAKSIKGIATVIKRPSLIKRKNVANTHFFGSELTGDRNLQILYRLIRQKSMTTCTPCNYFINVE